MSTTVTGKLNKSATEKPLDNGDVLFRVNIGKKERNRQANEGVWANYGAALFAKAGNQADFYRSVLQQGAVVSVTSSGLIPRIWGDNNDQVGLDMIDAKLAYAHMPSQVPANPPSQQIQPQAPAQQQYQAPTAPQAPAQPSPHNNFDDFDDDIPFN